MRKESKEIEFKEKISKSYLKTVSAYSNYKDGKIIFIPQQMYEANYQEE